MYNITEDEMNQLDSFQQQLILHQEELQAINSDMDKMQLGFHIGQIHARMGDLKCQMIHFLLTIKQRKNE